MIAYLSRGRFTSLSGLHTWCESNQPSGTAPRGAPRVERHRGRSTVTLMEGAPRTAEAGQSIDPMPAGHENCGHRCWREARTLPAPDDPGNGTGDPGAPGKAPDGPRGGLRG